MWLLTALSSDLWLSGENIGTDHVFPDISQRAITNTSSHYWICQSKHWETFIRIPWQWYIHVFSGKDRSRFIYGSDHLFQVNQKYMAKIEKFPQYWRNKHLDPYDVHKEQIAAANKRIRNRVKLTRHIVKSTEFHRESTWYQNVKNQEKPATDVCNWA